MSNGNITLVQSLYAAFGRGDIATIVAAMAPDVNWEVVGRQHGLSDFRAAQGSSRACKSSSGWSANCNEVARLRAAANFMPAATRCS